MSQRRPIPRKTAAKLTGALGILTMLFGALLVFAPGAGADAPQNVFQGVCTPTDASSGTCIVDEPMGNNVATHGTATYSRSGDDMTFTITLSDAGASISQIQACMTVASGSANPVCPRWPTRAPGTRPTVSWT